MAVSSTVFFVLCLVSLAGVVLLLQRRYLPLRSTPEYLLIATFLPLFISSSIIALVPIDIASAGQTDNASRGIVLPDRLLLIAWRIAYWLCFVLTWAILPFLQSYSDSGHRSVQKRIIDSLRENARYHLIILGLGAIGIIYFFIVAGVHFYSFKGLIIALSHCYALSLAIYLMGHGLIAIPRKLYHDSSVAGRLRKLQRRAPRVYDKLTDASSKLEAVQAEVAVVQQRKTGSAALFQEWIDELTDMAQSQGPSASRYSTLSRSRPSVPNAITEKYLAALAARLKLCIHRRARFLREWESLVQSAADAQAVLDSKTTKRLTFTKHFGSPTPLEKLTIFNSYMRHVAYFHVLPYVRVALAGLLALASASIVWTEVVYATFPRLAVLRYTVIHHPSSAQPIGFAGQCIAAAWLAYMCFAAYYSLTVVKVWGSYALVRRMTAASSACFYSSYAARLTVPLAYNFVSMLPQKQVVEKTVFHQFLGKLINLTAISEGFNDWFPVFILIPVAASLFNLYRRVGETCGLSDVVEDEDEEEELFGAAGWREGRGLIERELLGAGAPQSQQRNTGSQSAGYRDEPRPSAAAASRPLMEDDEETAWGGFVHRVRNTLDSVEAPRWLKDVNANMKRPRWMREQ